MKHYLVVAALLGLTACSEKSVSPRKNIIENKNISLQSIAKEPIIVSWECYDYESDRYLFKWNDLVLGQGEKGILAIIERIKPLDGVKTIEFRGPPSPRLSGSLSIVELPANMLEYEAVIEKLCKEKNIRVLRQYDLGPALSTE